MTQQPIRVAIAGCGNIAARYVQTLAPYDHIGFLGAVDIDPERTASFIAEHGGEAYPSLEALLADDRVDIVVNLTSHDAHYDVIGRCLRAGKHVFSEKPLAMTYEEASELVALAHSTGRRLSCAPITFMGEAQQTALRVVRSGELGEVRVAYAEVNWGRIERWHPAPAGFYRVGPLFDVGVYPLTILTTMFGPARRAIGYGRIVYPDRTTIDGEPFRVEEPDFVVGLVELANGTTVRLTTSWYVGQHSHQKGIELHGDRKSLYIDSWQEFDAAVEVAPFREPYEPVPPVKMPYEGTEWGRGVIEMAEAIAESRPQRATGEQAAHVVEILCAIQQSLQADSRPVEITSGFTPPEPMAWAR